MKKVSIIAQYLILLSCIALLILPQCANAHIKWFVEFDISDPPTVFFRY